MAGPSGYSPVPNGISLAAVTHLDRQFHLAASSGSVAYDGAFTTTWTLPYSINTDQATQGHVTVCIYDTTTPFFMWVEDAGQVALSTATFPLGTTFTLSRPLATTVAVTLGGVAVSGSCSLVAAPVIIGVGYSASFELSTIYQRNEKGGAEQRGRLRMGYMEFSYSPMTNVTATVTPQGRAPYTYTFYDPTAQADAPEIVPFRFPVQGRNEDLTIVFSDASPGSFNFSLIDWEATLTMRSRGV